ncbi:MAG: hypothetical protein ACRD9R_04415, partial [Pyrinomonadaceae bacterium]
MIGKQISQQQKGKIAEAAVWFRLAPHGFEVYQSPFDDDKVDFVVKVPGMGKFLTLQVRYVS